MGNPKMISTNSKASKLVLTKSTKTRVKEFKPNFSVLEFVLMILQTHSDTNPGFSDPTHVHWASPFFWFKDLVTGTFRR